MSPAPSPGRDATTPGPASPSSPQPVSPAPPSGHDATSPGPASRSSPQPVGPAPPSGRARPPAPSSPARRLRVLVVNWQDRMNPRAGGAEEHLHQVFGRLAAAGHEVVLLCSNWRGGESAASVDGMQVHRVGGRYSFNFAAPLFARRRLRNAFDVVVEDLNKVPMFAPQWARASRAVLLVHHLFGLTAFREVNPFLAAATWLCERTIPWAYRRLPCVVVSESTRQDLTRRGLDGSRIAVVPNGVGLTELWPARERYPEPTAIFLGRLQRYKGVDLILRALAALCDRGADLRLIVAGRGRDRPRLERLARRLGVADRVRFPGFVSAPEKREMLSRSWVHVLTSPKEGWGISSVEASACGTPTVASDSPGLRDTVRHGETGILVPHGDVGALARAIAETLDPERRDRLGRAARRMAEQYTWDKAASAFERIFMTSIPQAKDTT